MQTKTARQFIAMLVRYCQERGCSNQTECGALFGMSQSQFQRTTKLINFGKAVEVAPNERMCKELGIIEYKRNVIWVGKGNTKTGYSIYKKVTDVFFMEDK